MDAYLLLGLGSISQGLVWGLMAIGVYLTYRILDFADLSVEGTLSLGAAVSAVLIQAGMNPFLSLLIATLAGMAAGAMTGIFNTVFKIPPILAGILTMIGLYSINIRIMGNSANVFITNNKIITGIESLLTKINVPTMYIRNYAILIVGLIAVAVIIALLYLFFGTEIGTAIRSTGTNENMSRALGVNTNLMKVVVLALSNGLVGLSGAMIAQTQGSADVQLGQGAIVIGLAAIIIGEVIFCRKDHNFAYKLSVVAIGSIIYRIIYSLALKVEGIKASDIKLITALLVAIALAVPVIKNKLSERKARKINDKKYADLGGADNA